MRVWIVAALVALLAMSAHAYRLAFQNTAGTTRTYSNSLKIDGSSQVMGMSIPMTGTVTMTMTETVNSVNADGSANITATMKDGKTNMTISGLPGEQAPQTISQPIPPMTMTYTQAPNGAVSNLQVSGQATQMPGFPTDVFNNMQNAGQSMTFPAGDVQIGDSWTDRNPWNWPRGRASP